MNKSSFLREALLLGWCGFCELSIIINNIYPINTSRGSNLHRTSLLVAYSKVISSTWISTDRPCKLKQYVWLYKYICK